MVDCRREGFQDMKSFLDHVYSCDYLSGAHYWCPYCCRGEHYDLGHLPGDSFTIQSASKDCLLKKARGFFECFNPFRFRRRRDRHEWVDSREELAAYPRWPIKRGIDTFEKLLELDVEGESAKLVKGPCVPFTGEESGHQRDSSLHKSCHELRVSIRDWHNEVSGSHVLSAELSPDGASTINYSNARGDGRYNQGLNGSAVTNDSTLGDWPSPSDPLDHVLASRHIFHRYSTASTIKDRLCSGPRTPDDDHLGQAFTARIEEDESHAIVDLYQPPELPASRTSCYGDIQGPELHPSSPGPFWRRPSIHCRSAHDRLSEFSSTVDHTEDKQISVPIHQDVLYPLEQNEGHVCKMIPSEPGLVPASSGEAITKEAGIETPSWGEGSSSGAANFHDAAIRSCVRAHQLGVADTRTQAELLFHLFYMLNGLWRETLNGWPELDLLLARPDTSPAFDRALHALRDCLCGRPQITFSSVLGLVQLSYACAYLCHSNDKLFAWDSFFYSVLEWGEAISDQQDRHIFLSIFNRLQFVPSMLVDSESGATFNLGQHSYSRETSEPQIETSVGRSTRRLDLANALGDGLAVQCCTRFLDGKTCSCFFSDHGRSVTLEYLS